MCASRAERSAAEWSAGALMCVRWDCEETTGCCEGFVWLPFGFCGLVNFLACAVACAYLCLSFLPLRLRFLSGSKNLMKRMNAVSTLHDLMDGNSRAKIS